jgi:hypothetical protein
MKIVDVESFAIQAKQVDDKPYWGSRAWGKETGVGTKEISTEYPVPHAGIFTQRRSIRF